MTVTMKLLLGLICLVAVAPTQGARIMRTDELAEGQKADLGTDDEFTEWAATAAASAAMRQMVQYGPYYTGRRAKGQEAEVSENRPGVRYDKHWFHEKCEDPELSVRDNVFYEQGEHGLGSEWAPYKKCSNEAETTYENVTSDMECTKLCRAVAAGRPGEPYCCEFHKDYSKCLVARGWMSKADSGYGSLAMWRTPKQVRMVKIPIEDTVDEDYAEAEKMQEYFKLLVEQVNHMSIPGMIEHLLSFYICMRWVPDEQFMKAAKFEMENVGMEKGIGEYEATMENMTEEDLIKAYTDFDAIPLKCSSAMNVRDEANIDIFLDQFSAERSHLRDAYKFSNEIASKGWVREGSTWRRGSSRVTETQKALKENPSRVWDLTNTVHKVLPWDGLVRSSQALKGEESEEDSHVSKPKNLFFLCFGPRVASFPHKRKSGEHVLADQNMAGCNGLWDLDDMRDHMMRVKKMFAPETCLVESLEKKLKAVFLETFMRMNVKFEDMLRGKFTREDEEGIVRATPQEFLDEMLLNESGMRAGVLNGTSMGSQGLITKKYTRTARLLATAQAKWLICDTKWSVDDAAFGFSEEAFRTGSAYAKWLPELQKDGEMQCTVLDSATGCMKCITGVFSHPYRCAIKDTIRLEDIFKQVRRGDQSLKATYNRITTTEIDYNASEVHATKEQGFCVGALESARTGTPDESGFDHIVRLEEAGKGFKAFVRPQMGDDWGDDFEKCLDEVGFGGGCYDNPTYSKGWVHNAVYINQEPGCPWYERKKINICVEKMNGLPLRAGTFTSSYGEKEFGPMHVFEEYVPTKNNKKEHIVQYIYVCPCSRDDISFQTAFSSFW